jgi:hypothetical protein
VLQQAKVGHEERVDVDALAPQHHGLEDSHGLFTSNSPVCMNLSSIVSVRSSSPTSGTPQISMGLSSGSLMAPLRHFTEQLAGLVACVPLASPGGRRWWPAWGDTQ